MKEEDIKRILNSKDINEFYDIYFNIIPNGGIKLEDIDQRLVDKEEKLIKEIPKEQSIEYGIDIFKNSY